MSKQPPPFWLQIIALICEPQDPISPRGLWRIVRLHRSHAEFLKAQPGFGEFGHIEELPNGVIELHYKPNWYETSLHRKQIHDKCEEEFKAYMAEKDNISAACKTLQLQRVSADNALAIVKFLRNSNIPGCAELLKTLGYKETT